MMLTRRWVLSGLLAAPVVLKAASLELVRGTILPVRDFFWGKRVVPSGDYQLGLRGLEELGKPLQLNQFGGEWLHVSPDQEQTLDKIRAMIMGNRDGPAMIDRIDYPLGFRRIKPGPTGDYVYVDETDI